MAHELPIPLEGRRLMPQLLLSGAAPTYGNITSVPLSIGGLPAFSFRKSMSGKLPSAWRGRVAPASEVLTKSLPASLMFRSQVLNMESTPSMFVFLLGKPMLLRLAPI